MELATEFTVKRSNWLRGEGEAYSYLLRIGDGKMCCVGFHMRQCGITDAVLRDEKGAPCVAPGILRYCGKSDKNQSSNWALKVYNTNDTTLITDAEREARLTKLFAKKGITIHFED